LDFGVKFKYIYQLSNFKKMRVIKTNLIIILVVIVLAVVTGGFFLINSIVGEIETPLETHTAEGSLIHYVDIVGFAFSPEDIIIKQGETIVWTNKDLAKHTATSDSEDEIDSELLAKGESYSHTFDIIGEFSYHCVPHPYMIGKIIVE